VPPVLLDVPEEQAAEALLARPFSLERRGLGILVGDQLRHAFLEERRDADLRVPRAPPAVLDQTRDVVMVDRFVARLARRLLVPFLHREAAAVAGDADVQP